MRLALGLAAAAALLAACGPIGSEPQSSGSKVSPGTVAVGLTQIGPVDPPRTASVSGLTLVRTACDQLTGTDPESGKPRPALAAAWQFSPGAKKLSVTLRDGAKFHDGTPVTPQAVREALSRVARPSTGSPWAGLLGRVAGFAEVQSQAATNLSGVKITGKRGLEIELAEPYSDFPTILGHPSLTPVSVDSLRSDPAGPALPVCSGPYRVRAGGQPGRYRLVHAAGANNLAFANRGRGYSREIAIHDFEGPNDAFEAFKAGTLDVAPVPESRSAEVQGHKGYRRAAGLDVTMLGFDASKPATADPRLRQALSLAVDRLVIIDAAFGDQRRPAVRWLEDVLPTREQSVCASFARKIADPGKAKEIFAKLGADPATVSLPLIYDETSLGRLVAQAISIQVKDTLGLSLNLEPLDHEKFEESVKNRAKAAAWVLSTSAILPVPDELLGGLFRTGSPANRLGYSSPEIDRAIDEARGAAGRQEAARLWARAEDAACTQMSSIPMWRGVHHWITDPDKVTLEGASFLDLTGAPLLRHAHRG